MLVGKRFRGPCVEFFRCIFISSEQRRRTGVRGISKRKRIGIPGESVKLLFQLRLLLEEIRDITADAAVQHEDDDILPVPAEGKGCLRAGFPFDQLPDLREFGTDSRDVIHGHPRNRKNQNREDSLQNLFLLPP